LAAAKQSKRLPCHTGAGRAALAKLCAEQKYSHGQCHKCSHEWQIRTRPKAAGWCGCSWCWFVFFIAKDKKTAGVAHGGRSETDSANSAVPAHTAVPGSVHGSVPPFDAEACGKRTSETVTWGKKGLMQLPIAYWNQGFQERDVPSIKRVPSIKQAGGTSEVPIRRVVAFANRVLQPLR
jgi:hypothetical protein